jgi:hypothetical protein
VDYIKRGTRASYKTAGHRAKSMKLKGKKWELIAGA